MFLSTWIYYYHNMIVSKSLSSSLGLTLLSNLRTIIYYRDLRRKKTVNTYYTRHDEILPGNSDQNLFPVEYKWCNVAVHLSLNGVDFGDTLLSFFFCLFIDTQRKRVMRVDCGEGEFRISMQHMLVWLYPNLTNNHEEANILPIS